MFVFSLSPVTLSRWLTTALLAISLPGWANESLPLQLDRSPHSTLLGASTLASATSPRVEEQSRTQAVAGSAPGVVNATVRRDAFAPYLFTPAENPGQGLTGYWNKSKHFLGQIWDQGREEIFLSGYAYHDPGTYTDEKLKTLNNNAWGGGYGRTVVSERGNEHTVYAMAFLESHKKVQPMAGYAYQAIWGDRIRFGAGASVLVTQRPDIFGGVPFPAAFPLFSIGTKKATLNLVPIPKLSNSKNANNGNVLFAFVRVHWDRE
ncbi:hypothetical protein [Parvibium lacunae]|uniref:Phospholipid:lipid A palmitoyltransferase n=1 Tax=Parvibium lacunae TaxID=1888893 RepID=A0A368L0N4_9BURK|nr:hypothetical protein [Parvibium lacunae]RCS57118.1 hypothetical protein DU000_09960 [Parvibium lacunae]